MPMSVTITIKVYHCAIGDGHLTDRLGSEPILSVSVNLTVTVTEMVHVNEPLDSHTNTGFSRDEVRVGRRNNPRGSITYS